MTVFFGLALIGVTWIVIWLLQNDRRPPDQPMIGLFAMRKPPQPGPQQAGARAAPQYWSAAGRGTQQRRDRAGA